MGKPKTHGRWLAALAGVLLPLGLFLCLELGLRLAGFRFSPPFLDDLALRQLVVPASEEGLLEIARDLADPNAFGYSFAVSPPPPPFRKVKAPGSFRVILVADSAGQAFHHEVPRLEALLAAELGRPAEVINLSWAGCGSDRTLSTVREALALGPDALVVATGHSDFVSHCNPGTFAGGDGRPLEARFAPWQLRAFRELRSAQLLAKAGVVAAKRGTSGEKRRQLLAGLERPYTAQEREAFRAAFEERLRAITREGRAAGARVLLTTMPYHYRIPPSWEHTLARARSLELAGRDIPGLEKELGGEHSVLAAFYLGQRLLEAGRSEEARALLDDALLRTGRPYTASTAFAATVRRVAAEEGAALVDLKAAVDRASPRGLAEASLMADHCHLNAYGNKIFLAELFRHLAKPPASDVY